MQSPFGHLKGRLFGHLAMGQDCFFGSTHEPEKHFSGWDLGQPLANGQIESALHVPSGHRVKLPEAQLMFLGQESAEAEHCPSLHRKGLSNEQPVF